MNGRTENAIFIAAFNRGLNIRTEPLSFDDVANCTP